jgi:hypothetical protein
VGGRQGAGGAQWADPGGHSTGRAQSHHSCSAPATPPFAFSPCACVCMHAAERAAAEARGVGEEAANGAAGGRAGQGLPVPTVALPTVALRYPR